MGNANILECKDEIKASLKELKYERDDAKEFFRMGEFAWVMKHKMGDSAQEHIHVNSIFQEFIILR
jgi:hypothetical protein